MNNSSRLWLGWAMCLSLGAASVQAAPAEVIDLSAIEAQCDGPFKLSADKTKCEPDSAALAKLKEADCGKAQGTTWDSGACKAADAAKHPAPNCGSKLSDLVYNAKTKTCQVVRETPRSSLGDFVGDCFKIHSPPPEGMDNALEQGQYFIVESQTRTANDDKELIVSPAKSNGLMGWNLWCSSTGGRERRVSASTLIASGAHRYGWSYGVLTLPFKYYKHDKSFSQGVINVGPFLGRRWGSAGSAITAAVAATVGSVKGEVRDAQGNITSTPDLTSFSVAIGLMLDVSKNPDLKPFKMGLFYGNDRVNRSNSIQYPHDRKPWMAFQIGYDFTDTK